jgi:hypothetical protein
MLGETNLSVTKCRVILCYIRSLCVSKYRHLLVLRSVPMNLHARRDFRLVLFFSEVRYSTREPNSTTYATLIYSMLFDLKLAENADISYIAKQLRSL